jgi:hypothetical protein
MEGPANIIVDVLTAAIGVKQRPARQRFLTANIAQRVAH